MIAFSATYRRTPDTARGGPAAAYTKDYEQPARPSGWGWWSRKPASSPASSSRVTADVPRRLDLKTQDIWSQ